MQRAATHPVRLLLRDLVRAHGSVAKVARETGLTRYQVTVLVSEAPVLDGTIALAAERLNVNTHSRESRVA